VPRQTLQTQAQVPRGGTVRSLRLSQ
jgi:hypothetical protein